MKTKHLPGALLSFLYTIIFFSCGNNDEKRYILYPSKKSITKDLC